MSRVISSLVGLAFSLPALAVEPIMVPEFSFDENSNFALSVMLQNNVTDLLLQEGHVVLGQTVVAPAVGEASIYRCIDNPQCPPTVLRQLPARVALLAKIAEGPGGLHGHVEIWQQGMNSPVHSVDIPIQPGAETRFADTVAQSTRAVLSRLPPVDSNQLNLAARLISGEPLATVMSGQGGYGQPQQPAYGQPQQPAYGQPQQPAYGQPQQPAYGQPQQPAYGQPQQPAYGQPQQPAYGQPQQPAYGQPQQPAYGQPQQPAYGQPQQPAYGQPQQPAYGQPQQPAYGQPQQPAYGQPQQPAYGQPQQPAYGQPQQPAYGQPQQPAYGQPQQPPPEPEPPPLLDLDGDPEPIKGKKPKTKKPPKTSGSTKSSGGNSKPSGASGPSNGDLDRALADSTLRRRHLSGTSAGFLASGGSVEDWMMKKRPHAGRIIVEGRVGLGSGAVARRADSRVERLGEGQGFGRTWFQEGPVKGAGFRAEGYVGYAPTALFDLGAVVGIHTSQLQLTTGIYDAEFDDYFESELGTGLAIHLTVQPRFRVYVPPTGLVKPFVFVGADFRMFNKYKIRSEPGSPSYSEPPGGTVYGVLLGGGLLADIAPNLGVYGEFGYVAHNTAESSRGTFGQGGEWGALERPPPGVSPGSTIQLVAGLQFRL